MKTNSNKPGRKRKDFVDPTTGKPVVGLTRRPDGRWRIIGTHQTFREPNVQQAIRRFYELTDAKITGIIGGKRVIARRSELMALRDKIDTDRD